MLAQQLSAISLKNRVTGCRSVLQGILGSEESLQTYVRFICTDTANGISASKQMLQEFAVDVAASPHARAALQAALDTTQPKAAAYESEISQIRELLAGLLEADEEWREAAVVLQGIALDSGHRVVSMDTKFRIYVKIVQLLLEDNDAVSADAYLNRAALLVHDVTDPALRLQFQGCQVFLKIFLGYQQRNRSARWTSSGNSFQPLKSTCSFPTLPTWTMPLGCSVLSTQSPAPSWRVLDPRGAGIFCYVF